MYTENDTFKSISNKVNSLNLDQIELLSETYFQLIAHSNFFMSQEKYQEFLDIRFRTSSKHQTDTFKSLINLLTSFTDKDKYPHLLLTIDLIKQNLPLETILKTVYLHR